MEHWQTWTLVAALTGVAWVVVRLIHRKPTVSIGTRSHGRKKPSPTHTPLRGVLSARHLMLLLSIVLLIAMLAMWRLSGAP